MACVRSHSVAAEDNDPAHTHPTSTELPADSKMLPALLHAAAVATLPFAMPTTDESCPSVSTVGAANFNLTEWVRATWFIQEQQIVDYQPVDSFHCVAATYNLEGDTVPFFRGTVVTVCTCTTARASRTLLPIRSDACSDARRFAAL